MDAASPTFAVFLERQPPDVLQEVIRQMPGAAERVLAYLDDRSVSHSGRITGATLAAVAGVDGRTWRRWVSERAMPVAARRAIIAAAFGA